MSTASVTVSPRRRQFIFMNLMITVIASAMLATALGIAIPPIASELHIGLHTAQWLTSGYSIASAIMTPMTAFLITRFSTRKLYMSSLGLMALGLLVCAVTSGFTLMMTGRVLQALGSGIASAMAQVIMLTIYPREDHGKIMGWYGLSISFAPVVAPTLAGILIDFFSWRTIFYLSFGLILVSLVWSFFAFRDVLETSRKAFDVFSFVLSGFAFGGITFGVGTASSGGFLQPAAWIPLLVGTIAAIIFVFRQLHQDTPFLDLRLLRYRVFTLSVISSVIVNMESMALVVLLPIYLQDIAGCSATLTGLIMLPGSLVLAFASPYAGRLYDRVGMRRVFLIGTVFLFLGVAPMAVATATTPLWLIASYGIFRGLSLGFLMMPLITWGQSVLSPAERAHGTAVMNALRNVAGAASMAVGVGLMTTIAAHSGLSGVAANTFGFQISQLFLTLLIIPLFLIPIFFLKNKN